MQSMEERMMSVITSAIAPLAATIQAMSTQLTKIAPLAASIPTMTTQLTEQSIILAKLKGFKGQIDDLKLDVNDHKQRLTHLNSKLHK